MKPSRATRQWKSLHPETCLIKDCKERAIARGLCFRHYRKARRDGKLKDFPLQSQPMVLKRKKGSK